MMASSTKTPGLEMFLNVFVQRHAISAIESHNNWNFCLVQGLVYWHWPIIIAKDGGKLKSNFILM